MFFKLICRIHASCMMQPVFLKLICRIHSEFMQPLFLKLICSSQCPFFGSVAFASQQSQKRQRANKWSTRGNHQKHPKFKRSLPVLLQGSFDDAREWYSVQTSLELTLNFCVDHYKEWSAQLDGIGYRSIRKPPWAHSCLPPAGHVRPRLRGTWWRWGLGWWWGTPVQAALW